jgi:mRNA interferase RelE/StbE
LEINYHKLVVSHDIPSLDSAVKLRIRRAIENKLGSNPLLYGMPLQGTLKKLWKLRVGDWRVIYTIERGGVFIIMIAHRKEVYKLINKRT